MNAQQGKRSDEVDVVVVGSGVAGLSVALGVVGDRARYRARDGVRASAGPRVVVLSKGGPQDGSTSWAQGGVAAAIAPGDTPAAHALDTMVAGAGACDPHTVDALVGEGPARLADLITAGALFETDSRGTLSVTREGGHHADRIVHAGGDATGAEVSRALLAAAARAGIEVWTDTRVLEVLTTGVDGHPAVTGVLVTGPDGGLRVLAAPEVVLATGGLGHAYASSTNPVGVTGDGLALALRAGAVLTDLEFVQFHPTALWTGPSATGRLPLVSEAVRGAGATLLDGAGRPVMGGVHPLGDLAPRDIVARAIVERMADGPGGVSDHVLLDTTRLGRETVHRRFPTMVAACAVIGIDPVTEPVPVAPAEHFLCGGVRTDAWGRTGVTGLSAVGEVAATGVHGANRLASNSLLEGLVFGRRVATRLLAGTAARHDPDTASVLAAAGAAAEVAREVDAAAGRDAEADAEKTRAVLSRHVGIRRDGAGLATAGEILETLAPASVDGEGSQLHLVATALVAAAAARTESRGCHWRADAPVPDPAFEHRRVVVTRHPDGAVTATVEPRDAPVTTTATTTTATATTAAAAGGTSR